VAEALKRAIWRYADAHADAEGRAEMPIQGIGVVRVDAPIKLMPSIYKPALCLILQGAKQVTSGNEVHEFAAGQSVIVSVDRPVVGRIVRASREEPYLALSIELDMAVLREVMAQIPASAEPPQQRDSVMFVDDTDEAIADCTLRLVRLLDRPEAEPVLRPSIVKELHYWLLAGRHGAAMRRMALPGSHAQRVARVVAVLRAEFARPVSVERLAATASMSPSALHQHFKAVTSLSPMQFQKQLRLLEARRLMLSDGFSASRAAFEVGYESVSQFTREYGRMFGSPPRRHNSGSAQMHGGEMSRTKEVAEPA
jgi:AraC-like DNA-binding protein